MKHAALPAVLLLALGVAQATPDYSIAVGDPFSNGDSCNDPNACDVVGNGDADRPLFDIQKAILNVVGSVVTFDLYFDFGRSTTSLSQFSDSGVNLNVGDLFFTVGNNLAFAAPLVSHNGSSNGGPQGNTVLAGDVYQINNSSGLLTAQQTLNDPTNDGLIYRRGNVVWAYDNGAGSVTPIITGITETLVGGGDGVVNPTFHLTLSFDDSGSSVFAADAANPNTFGFYFASATCGNDLIASTATPEPLSLGFVGAGLIGAVVWGRRKQVKA